MLKTSFGWQQERMNEDGCTQEVDSILHLTCKLRPRQPHTWLKVWSPGVVRELHTLFGVLQM